MFFDAAGKSGYFAARSVLRSNGLFVATEPSFGGIVLSVLTLPPRKSGKVILAMTNGDDLRKLIQLHENGQSEVTIDSEFSLEATADANRRIEACVDRGIMVEQRSSS